MSLPPANIHPQPVAAAFVREGDWAFDDSGFSRRGPDGLWYLRATRFSILQTFANQSFRHVCEAWCIAQMHHYGLSRVPAECPNLIPAQILQSFAACIKNLIPPTGVLRIEESLRVRWESQVQVNKILAEQNKAQMQRTQPQIKSGGNQANLQNNQQHMTIQHGGQRQMTAENINAAQNGEQRQMKMEENKIDHQWKHLPLHQIAEDNMAIHNGEQRGMLVEEKKANQLLEQRQMLVEEDQVDQNEKHLPKMMEEDKVNQHGVQPQKMVEEIFASEEGNQPQMMLEEHKANRERRQPPQDPVSIENAKRRAEKRAAQKRQMNRTPELQQALDRCRARLEPILDGPMVGGEEMYVPVEFQWAATKEVRSDWAMMDEQRRNEFWAEFAVVAPTFRRFFPSYKAEGELRVPGLTVQEANILE